MFQVVARHWVQIFFLLTRSKCELGEVEKALFLGLALHFQLIFGLWTSPKFDLSDVKKRISSFFNSFHTVVLHFTSVRTVTV